MFTCPLPPDAELRLLQDHHAQSLFELVNQHREHLRPWFCWVDATTEVAHTRAYIKEMLGGFVATGAFSAGIWWNGKLSGSVSLHAHDLRNKKIEMGYWLAPNAQGHGLMTRAVRAMITHAFNDLAVHRVKIMAAPENVRSVAVCRRLNLREEGLHKEASLTAHGWRDLISFAVLCHEWRG